MFCFRLSVISSHSVIPALGRDLSKPEAVAYLRLMKSPCVYILARAAYSTLYVGVTSDLSKRMTAHSQGLYEGFTKRYGIKLLVYYEMHQTMEAAIAREKRLKRWRRAWKYRIIEDMNPEWRNLFDPASGAVLPGSGRRTASRGRSYAQWAKLIYGQIPPFGGMTDFCRHPGFSHSRLSSG